MVVGAAICRPKKDKENGRLIAAPAFTYFKTINQIGDIQELWSSRADDLPNLEFYRWMYIRVMSGSPSPWTMHKNSQP